MSPTETIVAQEPETSTQPLPSAKEATQPPSTEATQPPSTDAAPPPSKNTAPAPSNRHLAQDGVDQDLRGLGREALNSAEQSVPDVAEVPAPAPRPPVGESEEQDDSRFDLGRVAWLATVLSCLLTVAILVIDGYVGYAAVALAVALAAAINLL